MKQTYSHVKEATHLTIFFIAQGRDNLSSELTIETRFMTFEKKGSSLSLVKVQGKKTIDVNIMDVLCFHIVMSTGNVSEYNDHIYVHCAFVAYILLSKTNFKAFCSILEITFLAIICHTIFGRKKLFKIFRYCQISILYRIISYS